MTLSSLLSEIPGVGPVYQKRLKTMGILTVRDLLFHFPRSYTDLSTITPIANAIENKEYCLSGTLVNLVEKQTFKKRMSIVEAILSDASGSMRVIWFNQPYLLSTLHAQEEILFSGKVMRDATGVFLSNPSYEKRSHNPIHAGRIVPTYEETKGVTSRWLRFIISSILSAIKDIPDILPSSIQKEQEFPMALKALQQIHFPDSIKQKEAAQKRFAFEELFLISLFILTERKKLAHIKAPIVTFSPEIMKRFTGKLPFSLTDGQKKAAWHILKDIENPRPMNRILEGDVGSGKTVVAAMAALSCAKAGFQVAFLAPTEILAQQHFKTIGSSLAPFKITIGLLTGSSDLFISPKLPNESIEISRKKLLEKTSKGDIQVLIGTHALIQDKVKFANLALVVVDEQHRFGVKQRASLQAPSHKLQTALIPHFLSMTATPIPRTLAMTLYGDLDLTLLHELPKGRKLIQTSIVAPEQRTGAYKFIAEQIKQGRQAFVICPRIEEQEDKKTEIKTVKEEYKKLSKDIFPNYTVAMLHGKLSSREKEDTMHQFKRGKIDVLVSTSVVEVGVDIPNATVMMIEGADRFGLAQLHQFRGRVGRSTYQSYCFLFTESFTIKTLSRLKAMVKSQSGFDLAEQDFKLRGPGDFSGTKQWGIPDFAMKNLTDIKLVAKVREAAEKLLEEDITLKKYPILKMRIEELSKKLHLE